MKKWLLMLLPLVAQAAPPCFPGDAAANSSIPTLVYDSTGCAAVWFCDTGVGKWFRQSIVGTGAECDYGYAKAIGQLLLTSADKLALWNSTFTVSGTNPVDAPAAALALTVPTPTAIPPSGLFTQDTLVYKLTSPTNSVPTFTLVGTVTKGIPCDTSQKIGHYYRIDRTNVTFPKGVLLPSITYALCDP
jgi:hypothetical protein